MTAAMKLAICRRSVDKDVRDVSNCASIVSKALVLPRTSRAVCVCVDFFVLTLILVLNVTAFWDLQ